MKNTMRNIFAFTFACVSVNAYAHLDAPIPTIEDSWDTIRNSTEAVVQQTALSVAFGPQGYFNACISGDTFESIQPQKVCTEQKFVPSGSGGEGSRNEGVVACTNYEYQTVRVPIAQTKTTNICAEGHTEDEMGGGGGDGGGSRPHFICDRYNTVTFNLPRSPEFTVFGYELHYSEGEGSGGGGWFPTQLLFTKVYDIPVCK